MFVYAGSNRSIYSMIQLKGNTRFTQEMNVEDHWDEGIDKP